MSQPAEGHSEPGIQAKCPGCGVGLDYCQTCGSCGIVDCCGFKCRFVQDHRDEYRDLVDQIDALLVENRELRDRLSKSSGREPEMRDGKYAICDAAHPYRLDTHHHLTAHSSARQVGQEMRCPHCGLVYAAPRRKGRGHATPTS